MYIIKTTWKNSHSDYEFDYFIGKVVGKKRSLSFNPNHVIPYKSLSACRKAMSLYFPSISDEAFKQGFSVSMNYIEKS